MGFLGEVNLLLVLQPGRHFDRTGNMKTVFLEAVLAQQSDKGGFPPPALEQHLCRPGEKPGWWGWGAVEGQVPMCCP